MKNQIRLVAKDGVRIDAAERKAVPDSLRVEKFLPPELFVDKLMRGAAAIASLVDD